MCFTNNGIKLKQFRSKKRAITVWKYGNPDKTGLVITGRLSSKNGGVVWKLGAIVVPDKIRKPLRDLGTCSHGLYFYTSKPEPYSSYGSVIVEARVNPKDIIAVSGNEDEEMICCVKAKVMKAPNPDPRKIRIKYLNECLKDSKKRICGRRDQIKEFQRQIEAWHDKEVEELEAAQNIKDELKQLKKRKK